MTTAHEIVGALKGRKSRDGGTCRCPAHDDRSPSLSVSSARDGTVLVHCFAGCDQRDVISALKDRGLWPESEALRPPLRRAYERQCAEVDDRLRNQARDMWLNADPVEGTQAETYLRSRGITMPIPPSLRCGWLRHYTGPRQYTDKPAVVCAIQGEDGAVCSVQRIFLRPDGSGKTDEGVAKMSLAPMGKGALRLGPASKVIGLAEGPETALSAQQLFGLTVWCSIGAARMGRVFFPEIVETVHLFADAGAEGERHAKKAVEELEARGLTVVVRAPESGDWNDVLQKGEVK